MSTDHDQEQPGTVQALRELVNSSGWQLFREQANREWGPEGFGKRMMEALSRVPNGPDRAWELGQAAEQAKMTAEAVNAIMAWPTEQLSRMAPPKPKTGIDLLRRIAR